jgi:hypothetical protein
MSNVEAIQILKALKNNWSLDFSKIDEAYDMAIESLEQDDIEYNVNKLMEI